MATKPIEPITVLNLDNLIKQTGRAATSETYTGQVESLFGNLKVVAVGQGMPSPGSQLVQVGNAPNGFGKTVIWDRSSNAILLAVFINAADPLGISISGVRPTDYITVSSVDGLCTFDQDKGNPNASSIVGIIGDGLNAVLNMTGVGAAVSQMTSAAETFAQKQFKGTGQGQDVRDGFGRQPNGNIERQEGGILISLPQADGPYYSGQSEARWVKQANPQTRADQNRPPQVVYGFYPQPNVPRPANGRQCGSAGEIYITPWDHAFSDNAGYYKVMVALSEQPLPN